MNITNKIEEMKIYIVTYNSHKFHDRIIYIAAINEQHAASKAREDLIKMNEEWKWHTITAKVLEVEGFSIHLRKTD